MVLGALTGMGLISVGIIMLVLGTSLGFRGSDLVSPVVRTVLTAAGVGLVFRGMAQPVRAFEGLSEDDVRARVLGSVVVVPLLVAVSMAVADLAGATIATPVAIPLTPIAAAAVGFGATAVVNGVLEVLHLFAGPPLGGAVDATADRLSESGTATRAIGIGLAGLKEDVPLLELLAGFGLFLLGVGSQRTFSAPFLETLTDKILLLFGGLFVAYLGWKTIRGAARVVGW